MTLAATNIWRTLSQPLHHERHLTGLDRAWDATIASCGRLLPRSVIVMREARIAWSLIESMRKLSDDELSRSINDLRAEFHRSRETPEHRHRARAIVCESARRVLGLAPHLVQLAGAAALNRGWVAELATGEGKTLVAAIAGVLDGWRGRGLHVLTVNDYLAQRDAEWMSPLFARCGLTVGCITSASDPSQRQSAYAADITYSTNKEVAADYLRDLVSLGARSRLAANLLSDCLEGDFRRTVPVQQRGLFSAIVDEADSILIDEAVTPLILSSIGGGKVETEHFRVADTCARELVAERDFRVDLSRRDVSLTPHGREQVTATGAFKEGIWSSARRREELVTCALAAHHLFAAGREYVVLSNKIVIVDEFTGRLLPDRTWRDGLHQAIEAKENVAISPPQDTAARISFQRFFRLYPRLAGMSGTAREAASELMSVYRTPVVRIQPNAPSRRNQLPKIHVRNQLQKQNRIVEEVARFHQLGRPVLIGTRSIAASEALSNRLEQADLPHEVLNAVRHREEANIVAKAGQAGRITITTNMAGRGTDIRLDDAAKLAGGLHVIAAEPSESSRVDRQLFGRAGRQGDPGSAQLIIASDDELLRRFAPGVARLSQPFARMLIMLSLVTARARAASLARHRRRVVASEDDSLDDLLGFTGPTR